MSSDYEGSELTKEDLLRELETAIRLNKQFMDELDAQESRLAAYADLAAVAREILMHNPTPLAYGFEEKLAAALERVDKTEGAGSGEGA